MVQRFTIAMICSMVSLILTPTIILALSSIVTDSGNCTFAPLPSSSFSGTASTTQCYNLRNREGFNLLLIRLKVVKGSFNLYFGRTPSSSFAASQQLNRFRNITSLSTFALADMPAGAYAIGLAPLTSESEFELTVWPGGAPPEVEPANAGCSPNCSQDPIKEGGYVPLLGKNDNVIVPVRLTCPGTIDATVIGRRDSHPNIHLGVVGPTDDSVAYYQSNEGRAPVRVVYTVTPEDWQRGHEWQLYVTNLESRPVNVYVNYKVSCSPPPPPASTVPPYPEPVTPPPPVSNGFFVSNDSSADICQLYIVPRRADGWGNNLLGNGVLRRGNIQAFAIQPGTYKARAKDCANNVIDERGVLEVYNGFTWHIGSR